MKHDYTVKRHDYNATRHDDIVKRNDYNVKQKDFNVKRNCRGSDLIFPICSAQTQTRMGCLRKSPEVEFDSYR